MENKINNDTKVRVFETGEAYTICKSVEINNQWGYGKYLYQFEETVSIKPNYGLYAKEFATL